MTLKKILKEDIWDIVNGKKVEEKDFRLLVIQLLLENDSFMLRDALELAQNLKTEYQEIVDSVEQKMINGNGEFLKVLKELEDNYNNKVDPILKQIEKLRKRIKN